MSNRFVILLHESPRGDHWDLMLETGTLENPRLTTWSLPPQQMPAQNISFICAGTQLPDHRIAYLDYEGPISDHRGQVRRVDQGTYLALGSGRFQLSGGVFRGLLTLDERAHGAVSVEFTAACQLGRPTR